MHIRNVHGSKPTQFVKRLPDFSPLIKSTKKIRKAKAVAIDQIVNVDDDNLILVVNDSFSGKEDNIATMEEIKEVPKPKLQRVLQEDLSLMNISENREEEDIPLTSAKELIK